MSAHALLNLLKMLGKRDQMWALLSILLHFHEFNKFNESTNVYLSIYLLIVTLNLLWNCIFSISHDCDIVKVVIA